MAGAAMADLQRRVTAGVRCVGMFATATMHGGNANGRSSALKSNPVTEIMVGRTHRPEIVFLDPEQIMALAEQISGRGHDRSPSGRGCGQQNGLSARR